MQNKAKLKKPKINLTHYPTEAYNDFSPLPTPENKPKTNPKQSQTNPNKAKTNPKQSQSNRRSRGDPIKSKIPRGPKKIPVCDKRMIVRGSYCS